MKQYRVFIEYDSEGKQIKEDVIVVEETGAFINEKTVIDFKNLTEAIDWIKENGKFACDEWVTIYSNVKGIGF